ncbi:MAG: PDZ domain-containing protein [Rhodospirillales bacterium]|nr:PDZ domain-containing protein [Rhodospirillales bacterium]
MRLLGRGTVVALACLFLGLMPTDSQAQSEAAFVGLHIQGVSPEVTAALGLPAQKGVLVRDVALGGPSDKSGFQRGDIILKIGGAEVGEVDQVVKVVGALKAGQKVPVAVLRGRKPLDLTLETGRWPEQWRVAKDSFGTIPEAGLTLVALTAKVREAFNVRWGSVGVVISLVDADKAQNMDLQRGEIIVQVNQEDVWLPEQVLAKYREAKTQGREKLFLLIDGPNGFRFSLLPIR